MNKEQPYHDPSALRHAPRAKRNRGGQPGNHNARRHGLYCGPMTPDEMCQFWNILGTTGIAPEIAVLRIKLLSALEHSPGDRRLLRDVARTVARWHAAKMDLNEEETNLVRKAVLYAMEAHLSGLPPDAVRENVKRTFGVNIAPGAILTEPISVL